MKLEKMPFAEAKEEPLPFGKHIERSVK